MNFMMPQLAKKAGDAFRYTCEYSTTPVATDLLPLVYPHLRAQVCTDSLESVVTAGQVELFQILIAGRANLDSVFVNNHAVPNMFTALHWHTM